MNKLQPLGADAPALLVSLNSSHEIDSARRIAEFDYAHPMFDAAAMRAQRQLWRLQGQQSTWFCGSYFGYGFHEDGLQAGLAAAEDIGGVRRPWRVDDESGRITLAPGRNAPREQLEVAK
jgi:predicted NAD/FAD-binding protein